jgi:hypothetical protein
MVDVSGCHRLHGDFGVLSEALCKHRRIGRTEEWSEHDAVLLGVEQEIFAALRRQMQQ